MSDTPSSDNKIAQTFAPINSTDRSALAPQTAGPTRHFKRLTPHRILLLVGFIVIIAALGILAYNLLSNNNESSAGNQVRSVFSGEELKTYTSPENKFSILMPGVPTISKTTNQSGDKTIPITTYERLVDNKTKNYTFAIYDYTGVQLDEPKALESALNSAMQNTPGAQVTNSRAGKYDKYNGIEATYNVADKDKIYESHIRFLIKDSKMYSVILIGGDQARFDQYANSLRFD